MGVPVSIREKCGAQESTKKEENKNIKGDAWSGSSTDGVMAEEARDLLRDWLSSGPRSNSSPHTCTWLRGGFCIEGGRVY